MMSDTANTVGTPDWTTLPKPEDDGAARHLIGAKVSSVALQATTGGSVDLSMLRGRTVVYAYPRTGQPGIANPDGWDMIPGARGCRPQSCAFRDHYVELKALGVNHLFGLSVQDSAYQSEAAAHHANITTTSRYLQSTRSDCPRAGADGGRIRTPFAHTGESSDISETRESKTVEPSNVLN